MVADLSNSRAACIFETGCAVGAGRPTFIIREEVGDKLPFGTEKLRAVRYSTERELRAAVTEYCWPFRRWVFNLELQGGTLSIAPIRVFVTYSHQDRKYLQDDSLLGYLKGLVKDGLLFWDDRDIPTGEGWNARIQEEMSKADIALALVSQAFLTSPYCQNVEMQYFLEARKTNGLTVYPLILSPCDWESYEWLASTQFQPRLGKTVETDFKDRGKRLALFKDVLQRIARPGRKDPGEPHGVVDSFGAATKVKKSAARKLAQAASGKSRATRKQRGSDAKPIAGESPCC